MEDEHEVEFLLEEPDSGLADGGSDGSSDLSKSQPIITAHRSTTRVPVGLACSTNVANRSNVRDQEDCVEIEVRL